MEDKKTDISFMILLFIPVVIAISGLILEFNIMDLCYLVIVGYLFLRYFFTKE